MVLGGFGSLKVIGNITIRWSAYDFLFDFNRNYASILYRFRLIASYSSKVADFNLPQRQLSAPFGVTPYKFHRDFWQQKTRVPVLSCGVARVILCLVVSVEHQLCDGRTERQMDGRTDRQTDEHTTTVYTTLAWRRAVKIGHVTATTPI